MDRHRLRDVLQFFVRRRQQLGGIGSSGVYLGYGTGGSGGSGGSGAASEDDDEVAGDAGPLLLHVPRERRVSLTAVVSDGGAYSSMYDLANVVQNDDSVYCTTRAKNVNVLLSISQPKQPLFVTHIVVRAPVGNYTSPIADGVAFAYYDRPDMHAADFTDDWQHSDFEAYYATKRSRNEEPLENDPVAFFSMGDRSQISIPVRSIRPAHWILVKLIRGRRSEERGENIDIQYIGVKGFVAPRSQAGYQFK